jgi:hypothetical protein
MLIIIWFHFTILNQHSFTALTIPIIVLSGTNFPASIYCFASIPTSVPAATAARSISPVDKCTTPYIVVIFSHWVPFPEAGAPAIMIFFGPVAVSVAESEVDVLEVDTRLESPWFFFIIARKMLGRLLWNGEDFSFCFFSFFVFASETPHGDVDVGLGTNASALLINKSVDNIKGIDFTMITL